MSEHPPIELEVVYDGECPFCRSYVAYCRLRDAFPDVVLTNARDVPDRVARYRAEGMDVNAGMIVIYRGTVYHGDAAMTVLTQISRPNALFQGIMRVAFRWAPVARIVYVFLRTGRNLTLFLLGRSKID
ncbi:MAG: DCC1-like thiol-disulfide oxidoreductase family protein [Alphaproteobacteria bacterium]|nr:DCC1-like thiol-disulfide oxidoreductase family protein [Alphaproteobacteria bacterium]